MPEMFHTLSEVLPLFLLMLVGALVRRWGILDPKADRSLLALSVQVLVPALILDHLIANPALRDWGNLLLAPAIGFTCTATIIGFAWLVARFGGLGEPKRRRTFAFIAGINNYGYIPVPLVAALYSTKALGVLFLVNLGIESCFWIIGFSLMQGRPPWSKWRLALTMPVRAILLGVAINLGTAALGVRLDPARLAQIAWCAPVQILLALVHLAGQCAIPLALLLIGATMVDFWPEYRQTRGLQTGVLAVLVRNFVGPILFVALAVYLPLSRELKQVLIVQAAVPAAVLPLVLARHEGGDMPVALQVIFATTACSIVTLPLWIHFGTQLALPQVEGRTLL